VGDLDKFGKSPSLLLTAANDINGPTHEIKSVERNLGTVCNGETKVAENDSRYF
jgi:hypothetical protein